MKRLTIIHFALNCLLNDSITLFILKVKLISAGEGKCKAELKVDEEHLNLGGTLHGGYTSTLVDCISTYALMTHKAGVPGVSVDLHVT